MPNGKRCSSPEVVVYPLLRVRCDMRPRLTNVVDRPRARCFAYLPVWEGKMRQSSTELLFERLQQCEELAKMASDKSVREKAAELAQDYRVLISRTHQLVSSPGLPLPQIAGGMPSGRTRV